MNISKYLIIIICIICIISDNMGCGSKSEKDPLTPGFISTPTVSISSTEIMQTPVANSDMEPFNQENYIFVTKWGSKGSEEGQFGSGSASWFKITDKTIRKLENQIDEKKLESLKPIKDKEMPAEKLAGYLLKVIWYKITPKMIEGLSDKIDVNKLNLLVCNEFVSQREFADKLVELEFNVEEIRIILDCSEKLYFEYNDICLIEKEAALDKADTHQTNGPIGIAVDAEGYVYVSDIHNDRIQKFDSDGNFIVTWGSEGREDGMFVYPGDIAVDNKGYIYVVDEANDCIQKFDSDGNFITKWGKRGNSNGQFSVPSGIAVDLEDYVYVGDSSHNYIQKFDCNGKFIQICLDLNKEKFVPEYTSQFGSNIAIDNTGHIYVVFRKKIPSIATDPSELIPVGPGIAKFNLSGEFITKWGNSYGHGPGQFDAISGITTDIKGNIFVVDRENNCIQKFDKNGAFLTKWGKEGVNEGEFLYPEAVAVDSKGNVYVMDSGNHRVQKFAINPEFKKKD